MLEKPDLADEKLIALLRQDYGLQVCELAFLPLGADANTAVYRAGRADGTQYFLKLRSGAFVESTVTVPHFLSTQGAKRIIAPIPTRIGQLWAHLERFAVILSPFISGHNGWQTALTDRNWADLGAGLYGLHMTVLPEALREQLPQESYTPYWREEVRQFQASVESTTFDDPTAATLAEFMRSKRAVISEIVERAEKLAAVMLAEQRQYVLCHADIHVGNVLVDADDELYIVDWDTLLLAPKERDLMFVGAGIGGDTSPANLAREEASFYRGYGATDIDPTAIAYYRYERIVQDIAAYCEQLLLTSEGGEDRAQGLRQLVGQFEPDDVIAIAFRTDQSQQ